MTITAEQRACARVAGILILVKLVLELSGDSVTIMARGGESFLDRARYVTESAVLWNTCLLSVGLAWIVASVQAFALYVVLEPVNRRLAQLALMLRLGASFVGGSSLMFRVAQARLYKATETPDLFTTEQLRAISAVIQQGSNAGVWIAWIFLGAGWVCFYLLFLRSRYLPGALALTGIVGAALLVLVSLAMFVFPQQSNGMKVFGVPGLLAEIVTAFWLLLKGLPRETAEARA